MNLTRKSGSKLHALQTLRAVLRPWKLREAFGVRPACRRFRFRGGRRANIATGSHPAKATLSPHRMRGGKGEGRLCACNLRLHFGNFFWQLVIGLLRLEQDLLEL